MVLASNLVTTLLSAILCIILVLYFHNISFFRLLYLQNNLFPHEPTVRRLEFYRRCYPCAADVHGGGYSDESKKLGAQVLYVWIITYSHVVRLNISHLFYSLLTSDWSAVINPTLRLVVFSLDSNIFCCRESQVHLTSSGHVSAVAPVIATCPHTHLQAVSLHWFLVRLLGQNSRRHFVQVREGAGEGQGHHHRCPAVRRCFIRKYLFLWFDLYYAKTLTENCFKEDHHVFEEWNNLLNI